MDSKDELKETDIKNRTKMKSIDKLKEIDIKNRMWYYFDDITKTEDFALDNILIIF